MEWPNRFDLWLSSLLLDDQVLQWLFLGGLGLLTFVISLLFSRYVQNRFNPVKERIDAYVTDGDYGAGNVITLDEAKRGQRLLERLGRGLTPSNIAKRESTADKLALLGYRRPQDLRLFFGLKLVAGVALPLLTTAFNLVTGIIPTDMTLAIVLASFGLGLILPDYVLTKKVRQRQTILRRGLPDVLDMMVVCAEAGLGLNAAIQRVALEMEIQHPFLADELKTTMLQMGAGMESRTALQELANRTGMAEMRALVSTLQQAMRYGTSISETLRVFSEEMRNKRLEAAQEKAAKISVQMLIPVALCMLPAVLVIVMAPPMIKLLAQMSR